MSTTTYSPSIKPHRQAAAVPFAGRASSDSYRICANCVMDTSDPGITFDQAGVCDHCQNFYQRILPHWHTDERGAQSLEREVEQIKRDGNGRDHDCIIGISGGVDSSYLTYFAKEKLGLRPLIFHVDAGWNSQQSVNNIEKLIDGLGLDLQTEVIDWPEMQDLQLAFIKAGLAYADLPQDLAFFSAMYRFATTHQFKYLLTGANYATECVRQPLDWAYWATDLTFVRDVHRKFGTRPLKRMPMVSIFKYKIWDRIRHGMRVVRPLNHIPYSKAAAVRELTERFGWQSYPHKHYESRCTRFLESYWMPEKFGFDNRRAHFSSMILSKQMTRDEALQNISEKAYAPDEIEHDIDYFATKLDITAQEFKRIMAQPNRSWRDFRNDNWLIELGNSVLATAGVQRMLIRT